MKSASAELIAFLASPEAREMVFVDVFTFALVGGSDETYRLRYTSGQRGFTVIPVGAVTPVTYRADRMIVEGLRAKQSIGVNVDEQTVTLTPLEGCEIHGVAALEAILWGALDGARVIRDRFYFTAHGEAPVGGVHMFHGLVSTFEQVGRTEARLRVKSANVLLNQPMPRHLTQPTCLNTVYDAGCGLLAEDLAVQGAVEAGATTSFIPWAAGSDAGYSLGRVFFETMGNVGTWRAIKSADAAGLTLAFPTPVLPVEGEQFVAYPGCDRTRARCDVINPDAATRFRGFRFVPQSEKAL